MTNGGHHCYYFGGGPVEVVFLDADWSKPCASILDALSHGTSQFHGFVVLQAGLDTLEQVSDMMAIHQQTAVLAWEMVRGLPRSSKPSGTVSHATANGMFL